MANRNTLAFLLITASVLLLGILNEVGWLLWLIPVSFLLALALSGSFRSRNTLARGSRRG